MKAYKHKSNILTKQVNNNIILCRSILKRFDRGTGPFPTPFFFVVIGKLVRGLALACPSGVMVRGSITGLRSFESDDILYLRVYISEELFGHFPFAPAKPGSGRLNPSEKDDILYLYI